MIKVPLTGKRGLGKFALIDDKFGWILGYNWHLNDRGYAVGWFRGKPRKMHRVITQAPKGMDVDHINGDQLDNRLQNLRVCTHKQNCSNTKLSVRNKSGHKGVYPRHGKWRAVIQSDGKLRHLGSFETLLEARLAYAKAAKKHYGEFARII